MNKKEVVKKIMARVKEAKNIFTEQEFNNYISKSTNTKISGSGDSNIFADGRVSWISPWFKGEKYSYVIQIKDGTFTIERHYSDKGGILETGKAKNVQDIPEVITQMEKKKDKK